MSNKKHIDEYLNSPIPSYLRDKVGSRYTKLVSKDVCKIPQLLESDLLRRKVGNNFELVRGEELVGDLFISGELFCID